MNDLTTLQQQIDYRFSDISLLEQALTHRSVAGENNERLEFLGDAILSFIVADELYQRQPDAKEGDLSRMRAGLVNGETLAALARDIDLSCYLRLGSGELRCGGQYRDSILADAFEAMVGAIYLDGGFDVCCQCLRRWLRNKFSDLATLKPKKDAKSALQEWLQARKFPLPIYDSSVSGKAHAQTFRVTCRVVGLEYLTEGVSTSRRRAEQAAARKFLNLLKASSAE